MDFRKLSAEAIGTFWLTLGGCGSAVIAAGFPEVGIGLVGVSLAFGLTVVTMAYAVGHISGAHFNPGVTFAFALTRHFPWSRAGIYWIAQLAGALAAAAKVLTAKTVAAVAASVRLVMTIISLDGEATRSCRCCRLRTGRRGRSASEVTLW